MKNENNTIESTLDKLETIVRELENGELSLDMGLEKFEDAVKLYKNCREILENSEKRIKKLSDDLKEEDINL